MHLRTDTSMQSHFANVPTISHTRNGFAIAKKHVTTMQFDQIVPVYTKRIYPGDTLSLDFRILARLQTQSTYLLDDLYVDLHTWFTPMRLLQTNWARYQFNAQPLGPTQDNSSLTSPKITLSGLGAGGFVAKSLYDYLGFPTGINLSADVEHINNYEARGYNLIWNENYRDQNLQNPRVVDLDDGPDNPTDYATLAKRGKRHDKLTSALTAQQKGASISIPMGTSAPVWGSQSSLPSALGNQNASPIFSVYQDATADGAMRATLAQSIFNTAAVPPTVPNQGDSASNAGAAIGWRGASTAATGTNAAGSPSDIVFLNETLSKAFRASAIAPFYADLTAATAATLNQLRQSFAIQHLLEADARGGTRDVESIQHRWGVTVPDFRLQRPEYLGGQTFTFDGHIVPQTSETGTTPQANLASFSQAMSSMQIDHSFVEHGVFYIFASARSNITYQQGLRRELSYRTRYDWYQPEFANLGEVAIKNKEIYMSSNDTDNNNTFGFQEYAYELRYDDNMVTAEMRSNYATSLDSRHMADEYLSLPTLGSAWIESNTPISRNITVASTVADPIELNTLATGMIARTLPMYSVPGLDKM